MAALRLQRGLEAGLLTRRAAMAALRPAAAASARTMLPTQQPRRRLSGPGFEYKPLFQYDATPRDDPTEVSWRV